MRAIHWFRNDLRMNDNAALSRAAAGDNLVLPVFVVDPHLREVHQSPARSAYLSGCLRELANRLAEAGSPLFVVEGRPERVIPQLVAACGADLLTFNRDYTPYARARDRRVTAAAGKLDARVESFKNRVLFEADEVLTKAGKPFRVFTPYRNAWLRRSRQDSPEPLPAPQRLRPLDPPETGPPPASLEVAGAIDDGGESSASQRLSAFLEHGIADYAELRDRPDLDGTSRLSAALRFGAISPRTCIAAARDRVRDDRQAIAGATKWVDELIWREFYQALVSTHPYVLQQSFRPETRDIQWNDDDEGFAAWCEGRTGFPFVDAAMRQLVATGWMHNRARMIVASFLVKDLLIDWRRGERFFMQHLADGDPAANNGGWQWAASTGTDAQPYFRIFHPTKQGQRFDPDGEYTRRWVPELSGIPGKLVHSPERQRPDDYPQPIVDHSERRVLAIARFSQAKSTK